MSPIPFLLFAIAVAVPEPVASPEPLKIEPPPTIVTLVNTAWQTHDPGFVPEALIPPPPPEPDPEPAPQPKPRSGSGSGMGNNVEQWRGLVASFFPAEQVEMALCVMSGESGGNPGADNPSSSAAGLWQFLKSTWDGMVPSSVTGGSYASGAVYDPTASTRAAAWLWANAGWSQWNAASRC